MKKVKLFLIAFMTLFVVVLQVKPIMADDFSDPNKYFIYEEFDCKGTILAYTISNIAYDIAWFLRAKSIRQYTNGSPMCVNLNWAF